MRPELARNSRIDVAAVQVVAERLYAAAELIDNAIADHWARLTFDGAAAGRDYPSHGDALRAGLERLGAQLSQWSSATVDIAVAMRAAANHYVDADRGAAARIA
ncbi:type VII secretion target [Mycobacterium marinum]|uniref:Uncharacterized protein n=1 Tax=Mycobacterium marinum (strain ATCC BAA-535 / M) TaxID=216594 RepID=B2HCZ3_MYCMM|nr:type VII secretion target [Mycobacterium marinum]ACC39565.1 conserved hypothetical protein [Mycobacterium marinum M]RFZ68545.1 hypothetical protein DE4576_01507 [Mycobacterium marinum]GJO01974.1 hypothetical protein NJB18091_36070 [Mycobacterium marinum]